MKHFSSLFSYRKRFQVALALAMALLGASSHPAKAQQVVVQGFWWDYWNSNYPNGWANYMADLAPRLKAMGIDAVWMPPTIKSPNQGNGYSPFDNYDLGGNFNLGNLPGYQQGRRVVLTGSTYVHRTVPFVNNHDTFRPTVNATVNATGNYTGWNAGSELAPHIDPFDPRLSPAYAVMLAVDGSPRLFFEDLFNIGSTGKCYPHSPKSATDLPTRSDIENLVWCHQNLRFKDGAYKVRWQAADHLVIERSTKALIGVNDNFSAWQNSTVSCDFAPGTVLKDYSGANGTATVTVSGSQTVAINTPPCNGTAAGGRRGYSVWPPVNATTNYTKTGRATTQEWELANDLGDSDPRSLMQGGALPAASTAYRTAGRIYGAASKPITYTLFPKDATRSLTIAVLNSAGTVVSSLTGTGNLTGTYTPTTEGWYTLKARNASTANPSQGAFVKVTYTAPAVVTGAMTGRRDGAVLATAAEAATAEVMVYPNPTTADRVDRVLQASRQQAATLRLHDLTGRLVHEETVQVYPGSNEFRLGVKRALPTGIYQLSVPDLHVSRKVAVR